jgi:hypothetical protein
MALVSKLSRAASSITWGKKMKVSFPVVSLSIFGCV